MSYAAYNKNLLSKWCEVAPKVLDEKIETLFQKYLDQKIECAFKSYKFWKRFFPWLKEPNKEDIQNYQRKSEFGVLNDARGCFYGCGTFISMINRFCRTSDGKNIFLDSNDIWYLYKLEYEKWRDDQLKK